MAGITSTTQTDENGNDWFKSFVGAAKDYLIAREQADTQQNVIYAVPQENNTGAVPGAPIVNGQPQPQQGFSIPKEYLIVGGAALAAFLVVKVM